MATRIIRVETLKPGFNQPLGVLGDHHLLYFPKTGKVFGFSSKGDLISNIDVEKDDILLYNCGEIKVMSSWRKRVYNLTGKLVKIVDSIPQDQNLEGECLRRVNSQVGYIIREGKERHYISSILTTTPAALLKFLGKRENVAFFKSPGCSPNVFWRGGIAYKNISYFGYIPDSI